MAQVKAILEAGQRTGALDEAALAKLPAALSDQLRSLWKQAADQATTSDPG